MLQPVVRALLGLSLLWSLAGNAVAQEKRVPGNQTTLVVSAAFNPDLVPDIEVTLLCTSTTPDRLTIRMKNNQRFEWWVSVNSDADNYCQVFADTPRGFSVDYVVRGDATNKADENGCQYAEVIAGQLNECRIDLTQDHVPLTVYKKWIGAAGDEADVPVMLDCGAPLAESPRFINQGLPATWQISEIPPQGMVCSVSEAPNEIYISDESDCKDLLVLPGRGEACTMVNTKVVKRIEMLNRYGKIIMILVMMTAGLIAVRRYV